MLRFAAQRGQEVEFAKEKKKKLNQPNQNLNQITPKLVL